MSWDVVLFDSKGTQLDQQDGTPVLGPRTEIITLLTREFPDIQFPYPNWGVIHRSTYWIEFNFGQREPVDNLMLHIHGSEEALEVVRTLCQAADWIALDMTSGEFIDFDAHSGV